MKRVSSVVDRNECKLLLNKSMKARALETLKMPLFMGF